MNSAEVSCLGGVMAPQAEALRFIKGPDGLIWFDQTFKLPAEGVWICLTQYTSWDALQQDLARALNADVSPQLYQNTLAGLKKLSLQGLVLSKKAGALALGIHKCREAAQGAKVRYFVLADDAGTDTKKRVETFEKNGVKVYKGFTKDELTAQFGGLPVSVLASFVKSGLETSLIRYQLFSAIK